MAEERITTVEPADGSPSTTTHTTIVRDGDPAPRSGGAGWLIAIVLIIAVIAGIYLFSQSNASNAVKNDAIAGAAEDVGNAAGQVGDAVEGAADSVTNTK